MSNNNTQEENLFIVGLCKKANDYITKNSKFNRGESIGCKRSDGVIDIKAILYKIEKIEDKAVILFKYYLKKGEAYTKVQIVINNCVFISLETEKGKEIKWTKKEINNYLKTSTQ